MSARHASTPDIPSVVTHDAPVATEWMDLLVAEDDWVRREFDELIEAGWGGSPPTSPRTRQGAHEPRRSGSGTRPSQSLQVGQLEMGRAERQAPCRGPP